jgi:hypothetical protein
LWLSLLSLLGGTVVSGVLLLTQLPPPIDCREISPLSADGERLYCAQLAAESGELEALVAAVKLVEPWGRNHPLYAEAQRFLSEWSAAILAIAQQQIDRGELARALTVARDIPKSSPLYETVQEQIALWQQEWQQGKATARQFEEALKKQNWQQASEQLTALSEFNLTYWRRVRLEELQQRLTAEERAWQQLERAQELAKTNQLDKLQEAAILAAGVSADSYTSARAQAELLRWSRSLLDIAAAFFDNQNFEQALRIAESIPVNTALYEEARDWIWLNRAARAAERGHLLALVDALAAVRQIDPESPVYPLATAQTERWQVQVQDRLQLLVARGSARFGQPVGLQLAIDRAQQVALGRPQRLLAQTLIAQWRKEIQQIEDKRILQQAEALAAGETLEDLKAAVARASQIQLGQPLRLDAQTAIAKWNRQIQTLEDQPTLELARVLAQRGDLAGAVATAQQIRPERALYSQAQAAIANWVAQIQTIEDRPILEAAAALAAQGRYEAAIATASQISPERALYQQAQALTEVWTTRAGEQER